jgi:hypothetical protein
VLVVNKICAQDIVKSGTSLAILRNDFDRLKNTSDRVQVPVGFTNPLEFLEGLVPRAQQTGTMDFTPDPQLILRTQTSTEKWDTMVREAEAVMRVYNRSLQIAIEADKEASAYFLFYIGRG